MAAVYLAVAAVLLARLLIGIALIVNDRPSRSTDHAMTISNCRRAASLHSRSKSGRLSPDVLVHVTPEYAVELPVQAEIRCSTSVFRPD